MTVPRHHLLAALRLARLRESRPTGANSADRTHLPVQSSPSFVSISSPKPRGIIGDLRVPKLPHPIPSPQKTKKKRSTLLRIHGPRPQGKAGREIIPSPPRDHTTHNTLIRAIFYNNYKTQYLHTRPLQPTLLLLAAKQPGNPNPNPIARSPSGSVRLRLHRRGHTAHCACSAFFSSILIRAALARPDHFIPSSSLPRLDSYGTVPCGPICTRVFGSLHCTGPGENSPS